MRSLSVAKSVSRRNTRKLLKNPAPAIPPVLIPLFMFAAFAGALSALSDTKGFDYYNFTAFVFIFVVYLASMFTGAFAAFNIASDYESGLGNRLMLAAPKRMAIIAGYLLHALGRLVVALVVVWGVALAAGMPVRGGVLDIAALLALCVLLSLATSLFGAGVALRIQAVGAGTLILIPVFMSLFLSPVFVPREQLTGWLRTVADWNPLTPAIEAGRGFLADDPVSVGLAFGITGGLVLFFALFAVRGMRKAEKGPSGGGRKRGPRKTGAKGSST